MIGNTFQFAWEVQLIEWCQNNLPSFLINTLSFISNVGDTIPLVGIVMFFYLCYDKKLGKRILFNTLASFILAGELKNIFKRRRPYFDNDNVKCLKIVEKDYDLYDIKNQGFSFPSLHSSNISVITGTLYSYYKKHALLIAAIIISAIVGISRFVLGCHYPTDVIVGLILGVGSVIIFGKLQDKLDDKYFYIFLISLIIIGFTFCESSDFYTISGITIGFIVSDILDKKYSNFKNTRNIIKMIARLALACAVFLAISEGMKLPFSSDVLEANNLFAYMYRTARYAIASMCGMGLTPIIYKYNILKLNDNTKDE